MGQVIFYLSFVVIGIMLLLVMGRKRKQNAYSDESRVILTSPFILEVVLIIIFVVMSPIIAYLVFPQDTFEGYGGIGMVVIEVPIVVFVVRKMIKAFRGASWKQAMVRSLYIFLGMIAVHGVLAALYYIIRAST